MSNQNNQWNQVVPYVGTWIEMFWYCGRCYSTIVVPYVGTWIEIPYTVMTMTDACVVPYVGTWIEICSL